MILDKLSNDVKIMIWGEKNAGTGKKFVENRTDQPVDLWNFGK